LNEYEYLFVPTPQQTSKTKPILNKINLLIYQATQGGE